MNCKYCNAELEEGVSVCPACGELVEEVTPVEEDALVEEADSEEEATPAEEITPVEEDALVEEAAPVEKKKVRKPMGKGPKAIIAISLALVLLLGIATLVVGALGFRYGNWENNLFLKTRYTAPAFMANMAADKVVATIGDKELTNGVLQMYFGRQLWDLVEEYGDYLTSLGLDLNKPLHSQEFPGGDGATWEQYLLSMAIGAWAQQQTLVCMAEEENFQYPDGLQTFLDALESELDKQAVQNSFKDGNELVQKEMGATANVDRYKAYSVIYNQSMEYYTALYESFEPDAAQVEAYFDENAEALLEQYGVKKEEKPVVDVRHILLIPEGGTVNETTGRTVYTEEEIATCHQKAQALLDQWKSGEATEESFAQLAGEHSKDPGSNTAGGLYQYVYQGDMVETFDAWCFDESRKPGDTGVVDTEYGCHLMYFVYGADEWYRLAEQTVRGDLCQERIAQGYEKYPSKVYFYNIMLSPIDFSE